MEKSQQQCSLWYVVGVFLVLLVIQSFFMAPHVAPLAYSEFKTLLRAGKIAVEMTDLREAIERVVAGLEKKNRLINPQEKEVVAFHEAGHALVAALLPGTDPVSKISIVPGGIAALGYTQPQPTEDRYLLRKSELCHRLCVLLGGRVVEELVFGDVSTGAHDDLRKVSDMAWAMVTTYGMSEAVGLLTYDQPPSPFLPGVTAAPPQT